MSQPHRDTTTCRSHAILGLFPATVANGIGGIEASGRLAWERVVDLTSAGCKPQNACLFYYGSQASNGNLPAPGWTGPDGPCSLASEAVYSKSPLSAVMTAMKWRGKTQLVLVWHRGLLKLIPFFRLPDAKIVLFLHGIEAWRRQNWFTTRLLRRVDLFLSNSEHAWRRFIAFNPALAKAPHETVHLGIGMAASEPIPTPADPPAALMISRLRRAEDYKGHREMIAAWPQVLDRIPQAELWIAGDGDLREHLDRFAHARGLAHRVRFFGNIAEEQKQELLARCRCLAMPSRGEGFGLVYLEAMRMGRPCLISTLDAGREVVLPPQAGLAADPADARALTEALCRLLTPGTEWEQWSAQARRRYDNYFTGGHFQDRLVKALTRLID